MPKCPNCLTEMKHSRTVFYEHGEFNGNRYDEEGDIEAFLCPEKSCGTEIAIIKGAKK